MPNTCELCHEGKALPGQPYCNGCMRAIEEIAGVPNNYRKSHKTKPAWAR